MATFQTTGPRLDYFCTAAPIAPCEFIAACRPGAKNPMWLSEPVATPGKILPPRRKFEAWAASLGRISRAGLKHLNSHLRISHRLPELRATYKFKTRSPFRQLAARNIPTPSREFEARASSLGKTFPGGRTGPANLLHVYHQFSLSVYLSNLLKHKPVNVGQLVFGIHVALRPVQQIYPIFSTSHSRNAEEYAKCRTACSSPLHGVRERLRTTAATDLRVWKSTEHPRL